MLQRRLREELQFEYERRLSAAVNEARVAEQAAARAALAEHQALWEKQQQIVADSLRARERELSLKQNRWHDEVRNVV